MGKTINFLNNNSVANITTNFQRVNDALEDVLSLSGELPNSMSADLDMDGNDIINLHTLQVQDLTIDGTNPQGILERALEAAEEAEVSATSAEEDADRAELAAQLVVSMATFNTVAALLNDNDVIIGYVGSGATVEVTAGDVVEAGGFRFEVADSGATDEHEETVGGVKLYEAGPIFSSIERMRRVAGSVAGEKAFLTESLRAGTFEWVSDASPQILSRSVESTEVDSMTNTITAEDHRLYMGDAVLVDSADNGLDVNTIYYVITPSVWQLSAMYVTSPFVEGATLTGGTSGATATITKAYNYGNVSILWLEDFVGTFEASEALTDTEGGAATRTNGVRSPSWNKDKIQLAASYDDAMNGVAIDLTGTANLTLYKHLDPSEGLYVIPGPDLSGAGGAWRRQITQNDQRMATWWGFGPGNTESHNRRALHGALYAIGTNSQLVLPPGAFDVGGPLYITHNRSEIIGASGRFSTILRTTHAGTLLLCNPTGTPTGNEGSFMKVRDIEFRQLGTPQTGVAVEFNSVTHGYIDQCRFRYFRNAFVLKTKNNVWVTQCDFHENNTGIFQPIFFNEFNPQQLYFRDVRLISNTNYGMRLLDTLVDSEFSDIVVACPASNGSGLLFSSGNWKGPTMRLQFNRFTNERIDNTPDQQTLIYIRDSYGVTGSMVSFNSCYFNGTGTRGMRIESMDHVTISESWFRQVAASGGVSIDTNNGVSNVVLLNVKEQDAAARALGTGGLTTLP